MIKFATKFLGDYPGLFENFHLDIFNFSEDSSLVLFHTESNTFFIGLIRLVKTAQSSSYLVKVISEESHSDQLKFYNINETSLQYNFLTSIVPLSVSIQSIDIHVESISDYIEITSCLNQKNLLYRGQAHTDWEIESSLFRSKVNKVKNKEYDIYTEINQGNYPEFTKETFIENICNMQHSGVPTRLVDWTQNKLHALYFACVSKENESEEGAIFVLNSDRIVTINDDEYSFIELFIRYRFLNRAEDFHNLESMLFRIMREQKKYIFFSTKYFNDRIRSQKGLFSLYFEVFPDEADQILKINLNSLFKDFIKRNKVSFDYARFVETVKAPLTDGALDRLISQVMVTLNHRSTQPISNDQIRDKLYRELVNLKVIDHYEHEMKEVLSYEDHLKLIIPSNKKQYFIEQLENLGINSSTVYPDLEGMIRYLKEKYTQVSN